MRACVCVHGKRRCPGKNKWVEKVAKFRSVSHDWLCISGICGIFLLTR